MAVVLLGEDGRALRVGMYKASDETLVAGAAERSNEAFGSHGDVDAGRGDDIVRGDRDDVPGEEPRCREAGPWIVINGSDAAEQQRRTFVPITRQDQRPQLVQMVLSQRQACAALHVQTPRSAASTRRRTVQMLSRPRRHASLCRLQRCQFRLQNACAWSAQLA